MILVQLSGNRHQFFWYKTIYNNLLPYNNIERQIMNSLIHEMKGNHFPFGLLNDSEIECRKIFIKKRINYKNQAEYQTLNRQIDKLKEISHKNTINLRSTEHNGKGCIDLFYPYVPIPLQDSFSINSSQTVKQLHKQFIELAIYLAKQYILTSFNPARCGVIISQKKSLIKYYLPLNEIVVSDNISMLERSVQLFNLQSMHYLDTLSQNSMNNTIYNSSQQSTQGKSHIYIGQARKIRKDSQPATLQFNRKLSVNPLSRQMRKLSHLSKQISQISQMHKRRAKQSTRVSTGSFSTIKNIMSQNSSRELFKSYISQTKLINERVINLKERSYCAIKEFRGLQQVMAQHRSVSLLITRIKY